MQALGLVETMGILPAIEGADAMLKAADVRLLEKNLADGGLVTITISGEVSAVQASVDAAKASIVRLNPAYMVSAHVIPRPDNELVGILQLDPDAAVAALQRKREQAAKPAKKPSESEDADEGDDHAGAESQPATATRAGVPAESQLKKMTLNRLRQTARSLEGIALSEAEIASADKKILIAAIMAAAGKSEE